MFSLESLITDTVASVCKNEATTGRKEGGTAGLVRLCVDSDPSTVGLKFPWLQSSQGPVIRGLGFKVPKPSAPTSLHKHFKI